MTTDATRSRQPLGAPASTGGQFAAETRTEPDGVDLAAGREQLGGLNLEGPFTNGGRKLAEMVSRAGVCGTATDAHDRTDDWTRLEVVLATGDDLTVRYAAEPGPDGEITAVSSYFNPSDEHPELVTSSSTRIGGMLGEEDVHDAVRHAIMHVAASDAFYEQFPDTLGLALEFIGEQSSDEPWHYRNTPHPQECGARFTLDDELDVVVRSRDGSVGLVVDNLPLDGRTQPRLVAFMAADFNQRLGVTPVAGQTPTEALGQMVSGVIDKARSHPFWVANIDETKAGLL
ncbi:hypothetical protein [Pengzhenrongella sp.]|jgi:hypothetical protein|uniref:hypothetical protein n=1 Tax=Pengzhenrongella sp. TaxID=2888820 RepID=UPI002F94CB08